MSMYMPLIIKNRKRNQEKIKSPRLNPKSPKRGERLNTTTRKKAQEENNKKIPDEKVSMKEYPKRKTRIKD